MAINPITVTRLKTMVLLGHSNADGWAPMDYVVASPGQHLLPRVSDWDSDPTEAYWKGIYVATSAQPFPEANATPVASDVGTVDWLEMTVTNSLSPSAPHPHGSPYNYPNVAGACYPRWGYNAYPYANFTYGTTTTPTGPWLDSNRDSYGARTGLEVPLAWGLRNHYQDVVGVVKVAYSSSFFLPVETGTGTGFIDPAIFPLGTKPSDHGPSTSRPVESAVDGSAGFIGYWTPAETFDFAPSTDRFYKMWYDKMVGAAAALPAGSLIDIRLVVPWFGDNDSVARPQSVLERDWKRSVLEFVKRIRHDIDRNNWSSLPKDQIPIFWPKIYSGYPNSLDSSYDSVGFMNGVLEEIELQDEYFIVLESEAWNTLTEDGLDGIYSAILSTTNHFGPSGYRAAATEILSSLVALESDPFSALDVEECLTLGDAIDRVRTYYSKSRSNTDMDREGVVQHLNAAMYHVFNHVGDNAFWLTRRQQLSVTASRTGVTTMPKFVNRLLVIEDPKDPKYPMEFEQVGHGNGGRLQITFSERGTGTYWCQFITNPKELTSDDQIVPAPRNITEWIIVETCRRMAAASSNAPLMAFFGGEALQLQSDSLRNMGQVQRSKREAMRTQRSRPNFRYGGRGRSRWAQDW